MAVFLLKITKTKTRSSNRKSINVRIPTGVDHGKMTRRKKLVEYIIIGVLIAATAIAIGIATQNLF
jgi:hypothetical protein